MPIRILFRMLEGALVTAREAIDMVLTVLRLAIDSMGDEDEEEGGGQAPPEEPSGPKAPATFNRRRREHGGEAAAGEASVREVHSTDEGAPGGEGGAA